MHAIVKTSSEAAFFNNHLKDVRLNMSCNRHISNLSYLFSQLLGERFECMGLKKSYSGDSEVSEVYWSHDADRSWSDAHEGRLHRHWYRSNLPPDDEDHSGCLYAKNQMRFDVSISTADNIEQHGKYKSKWRTINYVLDDAAKQFDSVCDRLMIINNIAKSNGCGFSINSYAHSGSFCILIPIDIQYEVHIYDRTKEPCPYHIDVATAITT